MSRSLSARRSDLDSRAKTSIDEDGHSLPPENDVGSDPHLSGPQWEINAEAESGAV